MTEIFKIVPAPGKTLWLIGAFALLMLGLLCLTGYIAYSSRHVQFKLSDTELNIRGDFYGRSISFESLVTDQATKVQLNRDSPYRPTWRTNGIGVPGYSSGWFKLKNGEKALMFATNYRNVVYIPTTNGYSLLLSVNEPERFLSLLHQKSLHSK